MSTSSLFPICPRCGATTTLSAELGQFTRRCTRCRWLESSGVGINVIRGSMFSPDGGYIPLSSHGKFSNVREFGISSLHEGMKRIAVSGKIVRIGQRKIVKTRYGESLLVPCILEDETGKIMINLWGTQTVFAKEGNRLKLYDCYVISYNKELQLNVAKKGALQVL